MVCTRTYRDPAALIAGLRFGLSAPTAQVVQIGALSVWFEYGRTTSYGSVTPMRSLPDDASASPVDATLGDLTAGTTYHYRMVGTGPLGQVAGEDRTFTTAVPPPAPKTRTIKVKRDAASLSLLKSVRGLKLPRGPVFEVRVTHPELVGVVRRWRVRSLSNVVTSDLCVRPNASRPGKCPF